MKMIPLIAISLTAAFVFGCNDSSNTDSAMKKQPSTDSKMAHHLMDEDMPLHEHKSVEITEGTPIPSVELAVFRDPMDGVNVHLELTNYLLGAPDVAPANLTAANNLLIGHAHVFINGIKRQRLYGTDFHVPQSWLQKGVNQIGVSLNNHQHANWTVAEEEIIAFKFIDLSTDALILENFMSPGADMVQDSAEKQAHH